MRHLLKEYSKFILAEKFILNEAKYSKADIQQIITDYVKVNQDFKNIYQTLKDKINNKLQAAEAASAETKEITELKKLADTITSGNITNITDIKAKTNQYLADLATQLATVSGYDETKHPNIAKVINKLKSYATEPSRGAKEDEETETRIINLIKELTPLIASIFAKDTSKNSLLKDIITNLDSINNVNLDEITKKLDNKTIEEFIKIKDSFDTLVPDLTTLSTKDTFTDDEFTDLNTKLSSAVTIINDNVDRIYSLLDLKADAKAASEDAGENTLVQLLKDSQGDQKAFRATLESILNIAFNNDEDLVKAALKLNSDGAIVEEIFHLGATPNKNPFLYFIFSNKALIMQNIIDPKKYAVLHNRYIKSNADGIFTGDDLCKRGHFKDIDIIFSSSFYQASNSEMEKYLNLREQILKLYDKNTPFKNKIVAEKYQNNITAFFNDLMYTTGKLFDKVTSNMGNPLNKAVQSTSQIESDLKRCFDEDALKNTAVKATISVNSAIVTQWLDQLKHDKDKIAKLILFIAAGHLGTGNKAKEVKDLLNIYSDLKGKAIVASDIVPFTNLVGKADINEQNIIEIIKLIASLGQLA